MQKDVKYIFVYLHENNMHKKHTKTLCDEYNQFCFLLNVNRIDVKV